MMSVKMTIRTKYPEHFLSTKSPMFVSFSKLQTEEVPGILIPLIYNYILLDSTV